jgi:UDP-N-acetylmuramoyl-L-alanyl-D-glutamate--2,6-diaminopimelate ligase
VEGAREADVAAVETVPDRAAAIEHALRAARPGDVVAILGRGAKDGVLFDAENRPRPFDDRRVAGALIARLAAGG